jgi:hypothetical protein
MSVHFSHASADDGNPATTNSSTAITPILTLIFLLLSHDQRFPKAGGILRRQDQRVLVRVCIDPNERPWLPTVRLPVFNAGRIA